MPAKGKRVAARQAQLNRRRRRQARSDSEGEVTTAVQGGRSNGGDHSFAGRHSQRNRGAGLRYRASPSRPRLRYVP